MIKKYIKEYFSRYERVNDRCVNRFLRNNPRIDKVLARILEKQPLWERKFNIVKAVLEDIKLTRCKVCNKLLPFSKHTQSCCSYTCMGNNLEFIDKRRKTNLEKYGTTCALHSDEIKEKIKKSNLKKYGVEYAQQSEIVKEKSRKTCLNRYGVEHPAQTKEVKEKIKKSNLEKYGVEYPFASGETREKIKKSNLEKYGVENPFQIKEVKEKIKETNLERYGVENPAQSALIQEKMKKTMKKKYGVESPLQSPNIQEKFKETCKNHHGVEYPLMSKEIKEKSKETCIKRYGVEYSLMSKQVREKIRNTRYDKFYDYLYEKADEWNLKLLFSRDEYEGIQNYDKKYKWKCLKCGNVFEDHLCSHIPRCLKCHPLLSGKSKKEQELVEFCKQFYPNLIQHDRKIIAPLELDILIPELKLAIEFNR